MDPHHQTEKAGGDPGERAAKPGEEWASLPRLLADLPGIARRIWAGNKILVGAGALLAAAVVFLVWSIPPDPIEAARAAIAQGNLERAEGILRRFLLAEEPGPRSDAGKLLLARTLYDIGKEVGGLTASVLDEVLMLVKGVSRSARSRAHFELRRQAARSLLSAGRAGEALDEFEGLFAEHPGERELELDRALALAGVRSDSPRVPVPAADRSRPPHERKARAIEKAIENYLGKSPGPAASRDAFEKLAAIFRQMAADAGRIGDFDSRRMSYEELAERLGAARYYLERAEQALGTRSGLLSGRIELSVPDADRARLGLAEVMLAQVRNLMAERGKLLQWKPDVKADTARLTRIDRRIAGRGKDLESLLGQLIARKPPVEDPTRQRARFLLGELLRERGEVARALAQYDLAGRAGPALIDSLAGTARVHIEEGRFSAAEAAIDRMAKAAEDASDAGSLALAASLYPLLRDRYVEALDTSHAAGIKEMRVLQTKPQYLAQAQESHRARRRAAFRGYTRKAARGFQRAYRLEPERRRRVDFAWRAAEQCRKIDDVAGQLQALNYFHDQQAEDQRLSECLYRRAETLVLLGSWKEALADHERNSAAYRTPWAYRSRLARGRILLQRGEIDKAISAFDAIIEDRNFLFEPGSTLWADALHAKATALARLALDGSVEARRLETARRLLEEFRGRYPGDPRSRHVTLELARVLIAAGRLDAARQELRRVMTASDLEGSLRISATLLEADSWFLQAKTSSVVPGPPRPASQGQGMRRALDLYQQVARGYPADPASVWALYQVGIIRRLQGSPRQARAAFARAELRLKRLSSASPALKDMFRRRGWDRMLAWARSL